MQRFFSPSTVFRRRAAVWYARFPKLLLVTFLMVGTLLSPSIAKAEASPASTKIQLSELTMFDQQHGWAFNQNQTHVFSTHQGPEHWVDVTPPLLISGANIIITASFFLNATHGYIGILQNTSTFLLSTQNGGRTWQTTSFNIPILSSPVSIHQITFLNPQHGWLAFNRDNPQPGTFEILLMSTNNGGKTWQTLFDTSQSPSSLPLPYGASSYFTFVNPQNGWVTGIWLSGYVYLYVTHDGGKTWSSANITSIKDGLDFTQSYGPFWQNSHSGMLFIKYDAASNNGIPHLTAYQTRDAGKTWTLGPSSPATSYQEFNGLSFLNAQEGWSFGFDGQGQYVMHHTHTNGFSWDIFHPTGLPQADTANQVVIDLTFLNTRIGWLIIKDAQNNLYLFQTNNSGHTWYMLHPVVN